MFQLQQFRLAPFAVSAICGLLLSSGAGAAPGLNVEESVTLAAKPAVVWKMIGDYNALAAWHPVVAKTEIIKGKNNSNGALRSVETKDGAKLIEELLAYDGKKNSMRYRIVESPLPVRDYVSTLSVQASGQGSRVVWKSSFDAVHEGGVDDAKAKDIVAGIYKAGFEGLRAKLGEK